MQHFTEYLHRHPDELSVRWLLNLAYMTLGDYPGHVPAEYLLPLERFRGGDPMFGRERDDFIEARLPHPPRRYIDDTQKRRLVGVLPSRPGLGGIDRVEPDQLAEQVDGLLLVAARIGREPGPVGELPAGRQKQQSRDPECPNA